MKKSNFAISILSLVLFSLLYGCTNGNIDLSKVSQEDVNKVIVCPDKYIRFGSSCCLDTNSNGICDSDETETPTNCTDTTWSPEQSTICSGQSFTQTSNCGTIRTITGTKTCDGSISVSRILPSSASADTNFDVILTLSATGKSAVIVRDNIPNGCNYVSGGTLEGSQVKTVLGSLTSMSLKYKLNCEVGTYTFTGTYDGGNLGAGDTGGESTLEVETSQCIPDWECTSWSPTTCPSSCSQSRTCTDSNNCGLTTGRPDLSQSCTGGNCCVPDCSCASSTCIGQTCSNGCGGTCAGTKSCTQETISVARTLPSSATVNTDFTVNLALTATGKSAVIVRDNIPNGCTYISGGALDGTQVKTVLGSLTSMNLDYHIKCPAGQYSFTGIYDGGNLGAGNIAGDSIIDVG
jgi:coenzyme F420-reducing hydrogenase delta subunit